MHRIGKSLTALSAAGIVAACGGGGSSSQEPSAIEINNFSSSCVQATQTYVRELLFADYYVDRKVLRITNTCSDISSGLKIWICLHNNAVAPTGTRTCSTAVFTRTSFGAFVEARNSVDVTLFTIPANQAVWTDTDRWMAGSTTIMKSWLLNYDCNGQFDSIAQAIRFSSCFPA